MAIELVSYADLKALLGLEDATIASYPDLALIQLSVTAAIEEYIGRALESTERTEYVYAGSEKIRMIGLKGLPIASVSSVIVTVENEEETLEDDDYYITEYGIKLMNGYSNSKVTVVYTGGLSSVTSEINRAALYQIAYEYQSKDFIGVENVFTEGGSVTRPELSLLKETKRMLESSKHPLMWR
jgi:hypothetical protein